MMRRRHTITVIAVCSFLMCSVSATCPANPDPCLETTYTKLNGASDYTRSASFYDPLVSTFADSTILEQWYRATTGAGGDMPTTAPDAGKCQALHPIWLNGSLPQQENETVERVACITSFSEKCSEQLNICVKKCNKYNEIYNVYYLVRPPSGNQRYCFGSETPCADKSLGFTPCERPDVVLTKDPVLNATTTKVDIFPPFWCGAETHFECNLEHDNNTIFLQVQWSVDGKIIKTVENFPYVDLPATLTKKDLSDASIDKYGITIRCTVKPRASQNSVLGNPRWVEFYAGFVAETTQITVQEGEPPVDYKFKSTVPYDGQNNCLAPNDVFKTTLLIHIAEAKIVNTNTGAISPATCEAGDATAEITFKVATQYDGSNGCTLPIEFFPFSTNPMLSVVLPVKARVDNVYDGTKEFALQLRVAENQGLFSGMLLPRVQVIAVDKDYTIEGKHCQFYNDPHAITFDRRYFEMQFEGVFVLYRQITGIPIEVQGYFKRPSPGTSYTNVCGVAIRSYGELYVLNTCGGRTFHTKFYECTSQNVGGTAVRNLNVFREDNTWTITLPTGGKVEYNHGSISIYPQLSDYKNTEGLCGFLSDTCNDDLREKTTYTIHDNGCLCNSWLGYCYPNKFSATWRVNDTLENLFLGKINDARKSKDVIFCGCEGQIATNNLNASCSYDGAANPPSCVKQGNDETSKFKRWCGLSKKRTASQSDDIEDENVFDLNDIDPNFVPPKVSQWRNGWTENSAKEYCNNFFFKRRAVSLCKDVAGINVNATIATCVKDIHISGTTNYSMVGVSTIISHCKEEIQKNITLYVTNTTVNGGRETSIADMFLSVLCPKDCNDNGECENGECICTGNYTGDDCSANKHHVPTLYSLPLGGLCDLNTRPCLSTPVYGDLFLENDNRTCRVQLFSMKGDIKSGFSYSDGSFEHFQKLLCPLTKSTPPYLAEVSVSNDNQTFSSPQSLLVYDSTCWNCSFSDGCFKKKDSCVIQNICYGEDVQNPQNANETCKPQLNEYDWTSKFTTTTSTQTTAPSQTTTTTPSPTTTEMPLPATTPSLTTKSSHTTATTTSLDPTTATTPSPTTTSSPTTTATATSPTTATATSPTTATSPSQTTSTTQSKNTAPTLTQSQTTATILSPATAITPSPTTTKTLSPTTTTTPSPQNPSTTRKTQATTADLAPVEQQIGSLQNQNSDKTGFAAGIGVLAGLTAIVVFCLVFYKLKRKSSPDEHQAGSNILVASTTAAAASGLATTQTYHTAESSYVRPPSNKSVHSLNDRTLSPTSHINFEDDELSPVIANAWAPSTTTMAAVTFNFKQMTSRTGITPTNLLEPLDLTDVQQ